MSSEARKHIIRAAGLLILLLAFGSALLPLAKHIPARLVIGWLLLGAGVIELIAALTRRMHRTAASIAAGATILAGIRLVADPNAGFFPVLNLVILWLVVRAAALIFSASRSQGPLGTWIRLAAATDFLLAVVLLAGLPIAVIVVGLFGPTSEVTATFAWVFAASFVATGCLLMAAAPLEARETD
jgi:uncharacterized membrane protein HdeD (DUF308 family)